MGCIGRELRTGTLRRRAVVAALIAVAAALGPGAAAASAVTDVVMLSDPGDFIGPGQPRLFTPSDATITAHLSSFELSVSVDGGPLGDQFTLEFAAPPGRAFAPRVYEGAERTTFRTAG